MTLLTRFKLALKPLLTNQHAVEAADPSLAIAALFCEVSKADLTETPQETAAKQALLQRLLSIDAQTSQVLLEQARVQIHQSASLYDFTSQLRSLNQPQRFEIIHALWQIAYTDQYIDPQEEALIRKVAELLYVDHLEFIRAKLLVTES